LAKGIADGSRQAQYLEVVNERDAIGALDAALHGQPNRHSVLLPQPPQPDFAELHSELTRHRWPNWVRSACSHRQRRRISAGGVAGRNNRSNGRLCQLRGNTHKHPERLP